MPGSTFVIFQAGKGGAHRLQKKGNPPACPQFFFIVIGAGKMCYFHTPLKNGGNTGNTGNKPFNILILKE